MTWTLRGIYIPLILYHKWKEGGCTSCLRGSYTTERRSVWWWLHAAQQQISACGEENNTALSNSRGTAWGNLHRLSAYSITILAGFLYNQWWFLHQNLLHWIYYTKLFLSLVLCLFLCLYHVETSAFLQSTTDRQVWLASTSWSEKNPSDRPASTPSVSPSDVPLTGLPWLS